MKAAPFVALLALLAASAFAFAVGCSSSDETKTPSSSGSSGTSSSTSSGGTDPGTTDPPAAPAPKAPVVTEIMKMTGALHVVWKNVETACDSVEVERQATMADGSVMESYKVVFKVPGDANNKMDGTATADMMYAYWLRCKKGTTYSDYSNEMSANPTK